jgi:predicted Zn-dependent protease
MGEGRAAVSVLTAVLAVDGGNTLALRARGEILAELGQAREAITDLDRVTLRERPSTRAARGLALAALGDKSGANKEIADAIAEAPLNGAVLLRAAQAKSLNGDEYAAEELARRAVDASDPGLPPHYREVALLLAEHKHANSRQKLAPGVRHRPVRT